MKKKIKEYDKYSGIFAAPLKELNQLKIKNKELIDHQARVKKELETCEALLVKKKKEQDELKAWYDRLAEKETEVDDLFYIRQMKQLQKDLEKLIEREKKGEAMVQEMEEKVKIIRGAIEQGEKEADVLRKDALDSDVLV